MLFPRAIRLDTSDESAYSIPAQPGEWAVPGSFEFYDVDPVQLAGKSAEAFAHGFLGVVSFGRTTLVEVAEISEAERDDVLRRIADHFVTHYGAPDREAAMPAAVEEAEFAHSICEHPAHTLLMIEREITADGIREKFKVVKPLDASGHADVRIWGPVEE
ncbi:MAG: DUF6505 family protein [Gammaproteobacteria bacterium]|nr:DUF6505 family protein [Gammaproteobacteria bacterium]